MRLSSLGGRGPVGIVPAKELSLITDTDGSVGELVNGDGAANEMQSAARRRELKDQVSEDHGVVVSDAAVVLDREQEREVHALGDRRERARALRGRGREATVEVGDEHLLEEAVASS